jgi:hypothetical protein
VIGVEQSPNVASREGNVEPEAATKHSDDRTQRIEAVRTDAPGFEVAEHRPGHTGASRYL